MDRYHRVKKMEMVEDGDQRAFFRQVLTPFYRQLRQKMGEE
jgi:hypothetical protein